MPQNSTGLTTAASIMDKSASLMNDTAKTVYTYAAQLPYLQMALDELQEYCQLHNISITNESSAVIPVAAGVTEVGPTLYPSDLIEIQQLWERTNSSGSGFLPMQRRDFLSNSLIGVSTAYLGYWAWQGQKIKFPAATGAVELKIDYIKRIIPDPILAESQIGIINVGTFLYYRTASLCALFIGENSTRASELNGFAVLAIDRMAGINIKSSQTISTRRQPFRSGYKSRNY